MPRTISAVETGRLKTSLVRFIYKDSFPRQPHHGVSGLRLVICLRVYDLDGSTVFETGSPCSDDLVAVRQALKDRDHLVVVGAGVVVFLLSFVVQAFSYEFRNKEKNLLGRKTYVI